MIPMQNIGEKMSEHSHSMSLTKSPLSKTSPTNKKSIASERMDPKILDSRLRNLITSAKDKLQRLTSEVMGLKKESNDLQEALELSNQQKTDLVEKENSHKERLSEIKKENEALLAHKNDLDQKILKAKDELQSLIKLHNQNIKQFTVKLNQLNTKERQEALKREETKTNIDQQNSQVKRENEELKLAIIETTKKVDAMKEIIAQSKEIEQRRVENLSKDVKDLEELISANP